MKRIRTKLFVFTALAFAFIQAAAPARLQVEIDQLNGDEALQHGVWGFCVLTADSGKIIASNNEQLSVMPASTMKILTTGAALGLLGPGFRYETKIEYDGVFDSIAGILRGNLYIHGCGDPSLESEYFEKKDTLSEFRNLAARLAKRGIKKIEGNIVGDASCFSDNPIPDGWAWSDIGQYYGAGTSGLTYRGNKVSLFFNSTKGDSAVLEKTDPVQSDVKYVSYVTTDANKDESLVYGAPYGNVYYIYGSIPPGKKEYEVQAANPEPAYQCASDLYTSLAAVMTITGHPTTLRRMSLQHLFIKAKRKTLTSVFSPRLADIIYYTNLKSDNTFAEQLARTLGLLKGEGGTTEAGTTVIKNYWQSQGITLDGLSMNDGSGLSRSDLVTTNIEAAVLQKISKMKWFSDFNHSLPVAGKTGSLSSMCKGTAAENNIHAKTGYITRARGYAGYVKTKSGKLLCFSLLANNYTCSPADMKKKLEKFLVAMAELE